MVLAEHAAKEGWEVGIPQSHELKLVGGREYIDQTCLKCLIRRQQLPGRIKEIKFVVGEAARLDCSMLGQGMCWGPGALFNSKKCGRKCSAHTHATIINIGMLHVC